MKLNDKGHGTVWYSYVLVGSTTRMSASIIGSLVLAILRYGSEEVRVLLLRLLAGDGALGAVSDDHRLEVLGHASHGLNRIRAGRTYSKKYIINHLYYSAGLN